MQLSLSMWSIKSRFLQALYLIFIFETLFYKVATNAKALSAVPCGTQRTLSQEVMLNVCHVHSSTQNDKHLQGAPYNLQFSNYMRSFDPSSLAFCGYVVPKLSVVHCRSIAIWPFMSDTMRLLELWLHIWGNMNLYATHSMFVQAATIHVMVT